MDQIRSGLDELNRHLSTMEVNIDMLPSYEKGSYKMEVLEFRRQYEYVREQYFDIDKGYEADRLERENDPIF